MTHPELRGIARMTKVVPPLEQMGRLTAERAINPSRAREKPLQSGHRFASPTFLAGSAAVFLIVGAAVGLSPNVDAGFGPQHHPMPSLHWGAKLSDASVLSARETASFDDEAARRSVARAIDERPASVTEPGAPDMITTAGDAQEAPRLEAVSASLSEDDAVSPKAGVVLTEQKIEPKLIEPLYTAMVRGLPEGSRVSRGVELGDREWVVAIEDLKDAKILIPAGTKKPVVARVAISQRDGSALVEFPLVVDPQGHIDTDTIATVAVPIDREASPSMKVAQAEPAPAKATRGQKVASAPKNAKRKASPAALRSAPQIPRNGPAPAPASSIAALDEEDKPVATPIAALAEGSAGLETFKTFSIYSAQ